MGKSENNRSRKEKNLNHCLVSGQTVNYYFHCKRQLWFYHKKINCEHFSEDVRYGKHVEDVYFKNRKSIAFDNASIDIINAGENEIVVGELKSSSKPKKAHFFQLLYYLYVLKQKGIFAKGILHYPIIKKKFEVVLTAEKEKELKTILKDIKKICSLERPPKESIQPKCKRCSYYELCFA